MIAQPLGKFKIVAPMILVAAMASCSTVPSVDVADIADRVGDPTGSNNGIATMAAAAATPSKQHQCLTRELHPVLSKYRQMGVSVHDYRSGTTWSYRGTYRSNMASLTKLSTAVAVIMRAESTRRALTPTEKRHITNALTVSDNNAQTALWKSIGQHAGYDRYVKRMGLKSTSSARGYGWGRTFSTANDQRLLMDSLVKGKILNRTNRTWLLSVMAGVNREQVWGSSPMGKPSGLTVRVKNGWSPYVDTNKWRLTSAGHISGKSVNYTVAIVSNGWSNQGHGIPVLNSVGSKVYNCLK